MALFKDFFSSSRAFKANHATNGGLDSQNEELGGARGPETMPAKMNLEERMAFRRELLYEAILISLTSRFITANTYRFKVMHTDKRGHCFVVMLDMSPTFMDSPAGQHASLKETAGVLITNAKTKYGLMVGGVYWRADETLDASVANWARPGTPTSTGSSSASQRQTNIEKFEEVTAEEIAEFEAAWQKNSAIQVGARTYSSDMAPLMEESRK